MSEPGDPHERLSLSVPAGADQIGAVRGFLGTVAHHFGLEDAQVEDLKVAVSEICGGAGERAGSGRISLEIALRGADLQVEVSGVPRFDPGGEGEVDAFRRRLIDALIPQASFTPSEDTMAVRFVVTPTA